MGVARDEGTRVSNGYPHIAHLSPTFCTAFLPPKTILLYRPLILFHFEKVMLVMAGEE